jgi:hypothetical protein
MRLTVVVALCLGAALLAAAPARAVVSVGQAANAFTKDSLAGNSAGAAVSLSDYGQRVKILFILGYD